MAQSYNLSYVHNWKNEEMFQLLTSYKSRFFLNFYINIIHFAVGHFHNLIKYILHIFLYICRWLTGILCIMYIHDGKNDERKIHVQKTLITLYTTFLLNSCIINKNVRVNFSNSETLLKLFFYSETYNLRKFHRNLTFQTWKPYEPIKIIF